MPDRSLTPAARAATGDRSLPVCLVNTAGAGGLLELDRRATRPELAGLRIVSVWSALRDLDHPAENAARVVAAADQLAGADPAPVIRVELPDVPGWERAVEVVEAAGLEAAVRWPADDPGIRLAERLRLLVEADLPFAVRDDRAGSAVRPTGLLGLLGLVAALVDGEPPAAAASRISRPEPLSPGAAPRIRRRLRAVVVPDLGAALSGLRELRELSGS